jgi:probable rRNA maturation factor
MRRFQVFNRQRTLTLDRVLLRRLARSLLEESLDHQDYELGVHLVAAEEMARLNETFLGHHGSTDVITFNHQENGADERLCGEIFISVEDALVYARRFGVRWPKEVTRYLVHGVLHLEGFNDTDPVSRRAMKRQENKLLKELSHRFNLGKLGRHGAK